MQEVSRSEARGVASGEVIVGVFGQRDRGQGVSACSCAYTGAPASMFLSMYSFAIDARKAAHAYRRSSSFLLTFMVIKHHCRSMIISTLGSFHSVQELTRRDSLCIFPTFIVFRTSRNLNFAPLEALNDAFLERKRRWGRHIVFSG